jgi:arylsulfatase
MEDDSPVDLIDDDFYMTDAVTDKAVSMIISASRETQPFFLYLAYTAPHWPLHAHPEDIARYEGAYVKGWDYIRTARHEEMLAKGILEYGWRISPRDPGAIAWENSRHRDWEDSRMAVYSAMVDRMDQGVGRVMRALENSGVVDDTLILFLSDNGGCAEYLAEDGWATNYPLQDVHGVSVTYGNNPYVRPGSATTFMSYELPWSNVSNVPFRMHKSWVHEGGISTPLVAHWPNGIRETRFVHQARHVVDIMPTILDITGASYPSDFGGHGIQDLDGESMAQLFSGQDGERQQAIYWEHEGNCAVRQGDWKLVREFGQDWELYNMKEDRTELENLRHKDSQLANNLSEDFNAWAEQVGVVDWEIQRNNPNMNWVKDGK